MRNAARMGLNPAWITAIGTDVVGDDLRTRFEGAGVQARTPDGTTDHAFRVTVSFSDGRDRGCLSLRPAPVDWRGAVDGIRSRSVAKESVATVPVVVHDTTGSSDTFAAVFLALLAMARSVRLALAAANQAGAESVPALGGVDTHGRLDRLIQTRGSHGQHELSR